ncbi:MAG: hypothetical protein GY809_09410 [Planctomycetes bacterium]|nr:hypothetical protein [Planctomycetota bacterium]
MNDRQRHIQEKVDEAMGLLEHPASVRAGPWFRSHTLNKLRRTNEPAASKWASWGLMWLRPGILAVVVALNFATFFAALNPSTETQDIRTTYLSTMASEYQLSVSSELLQTYETPPEP